MRKKWLRILGVSVLLFVTIEMVSCRILDEVRMPVEADGLSRDSIEAAGWTVSYLAALNTDPDAQRIVYVHGTPGSATAFERYLVDPLPDFESISVDRPGFGHTRPATPALKLSEQAAALGPFLVERGGKWPILVGHSMGAPIICRVAADYPGRVGGLVILSGALDPALEKIHWYQRLANFAIVPYMIPRSLRNANRELYPLKRELEILKPLLKDIECPVVILHGPNDILVPFENVDYMKAQFSEEALADVIVLEGKNHFIPWNAEAAVRNAILRAAGREAGG